MSKPSFLAVSVALVGLVSFQPSHVAAQATSESPQATRAAPGGPPLGWSREFGVAIIANPAFQGSSSYDAFPVPYFDVRFADAKGVKYFGNIPQGFGGYVYRGRDSGSVTSDIFVSIAPGFANREPDDIDGLNEFGAAVEARIGWEYGNGPWGLNATVAQALGTGHEGLYVELGASWRTRIGRRGFASLGPTVRLGDSQYMNALYGITNVESQRTGIGRFEADSGLESVGVQGILSVPVSETWRLTTVVGLSRLANDAEDSTLTEEPNQGFFLTALTRRF
ncbi:MAG: MipA/OmpV family protein [Pseudomonadota bacterium]